MLVSNITSFLLSAPFDYLILGGGTAGLTIATRLAQHNPSIKVGVLEAGKWEDDDPRVYIPGFFGQALGSDLDWGFQTVPQENLDGAVIPWARGKMLGGSSGLNFMQWSRAAASEYDSWEKRLGNKGWNWKSLLPYFKKSETIFQPTTEEQLEVAPIPPYDPTMHGMTGPVRTSFAKWHNEAAPAFLKSLESIGIKLNKEPLGGHNLGSFVSLASVNPEYTTRSYAASAYLKPELKRDNLIVLTGAMVSKILLFSTGPDSKGKLRAIGAEFIVNGKTYTIKANHEVILSAGSIQSPQLLELSGIGNPAILSKAGIPSRVNNPNVGEHLQEHHLVPIVYEFRPGVVTSDLFINNTFLSAARAEYESKGTGILSSSPAHFAIVSPTSLLSKADMTSLVHQAQQITDKTSILDNALLSHLTDPAIGHVEFLFLPRMLLPLTPPEEGKTFLTLIAAVMKPFSRGSIHITTSDPFVSPAINPRVYSSAIDRKLALASIRFLAEKVATASPLSKYLAKRVIPPEGEVLGDKDWWAHVKKTTQTVKHPIATCAMLPEKEGGVVDEELRVYGVDGLRVVDASVIPLHLDAHLQATVYAIAERAVDFILEQWKKGKSAHHY